MLNYVFYTLYKFVLITPSRDELPEHIAGMALAFILWFNTILLGEILLAYNITFLEDLYSNKVIYVGAFLLLYGVCYFTFIKGEKYLKIAEKHDQESKRQKIVKMSLVGLYVIGSFVLLAII